MKITSIIIFVFIFLNIKSQHSVSYQHDANGNRIQRVFVGLNFRFNPNLPNQDSTKQMNDERESIMKHGLSVYPNPTQDAVSGSLNKAGVNNEEENKNTTVYLMDSGGKILAQQKYTGNENNFDLSNQPAGNYYIRVTFSKKENVYYKIVKIN